MSKFILTILFFHISIINVFSQESPYKLRPWIDGPVIVGGGVLSLVGLNQLRHKDGLGESTINKLNRNDVNAFDRGATYHFDKHAKTYGNIIMYSSLAGVPIYIAADKKVRSDFITAGVIALETGVVVSVIYNWTVAYADRARPYLYNPNVSISDKVNHKNDNSFFAGHPCATAVPTFLIAKFYHDYHPESKARKWVWAAAALPPIAVAYFRYKGGQHFPTDDIVGIGLAAATCIIVPQLHKVNSKSDAMLYPTPGGLGMVYKF